MKLIATTLIFLLSINITFAKPSNQKPKVPKIIEELKIKKKWSDLHKYNPKGKHKKHTYSRKKIKHLIEIDSEGKRKGHFDIDTIESADVNLLKFEIKTKLNKYKVETFEYVFHAKGTPIGFNSSFKSATIIEDGDSQLVSTDISELEAGEYYIFAKITGIKNHKNSDKHKHKFIRFAVGDFEREQLDSAHANITIVKSDDNGTFWNTFNVSQSYSDIGDLDDEFKLQIYKDEVLYTEKLRGFSWGAQFNETFNELGNYRVEIEVTDSSGDVDIASTDSFAINITAPILIYTLEQDSNSPGILHYDISKSYSNDGAKVNSFYIQAFQNDELVFDHHVGNTKGQFNFPVRGEFDLYVFALTENDAYTIERDKLSFISPDIPEETYVDFLWTWRDPDDPRYFSANFKTNVSESEIKFIKVKGMNELGDSFEVDDYDFDIFAPQMFQVSTNLKAQGNWIFEYFIYNHDDVSVASTKIFESFAYELGTPSFSMTLTTSEESKTHLIGVVDESQNNPGNFGEINLYFCDFTNAETDEVIRHVNDSLEFDVYLPYKAIWNAQCFAKTTLDLETQKVNFSFDARNTIPTALLEIEHIMGRDYLVKMDSTDEDGYPISEDLVYYHVETGFRSEWPYGGDYNVNLHLAGTWRFEFSTQDNDGEWSEKVIQEVIVVNEKPIISNLRYSQPDIGHRSYRIEFDTSDIDGYVVNAEFVMINPAGEESIFENAWDGIDMWLGGAEDFGTWQISLRVFDNEGAQTLSEAMILNVQNSTPTISNISYSQPDPSNKQYRIAFDDIDSDGWIDETTLTLTTPTGEVLPTQIAWNGMYVELAEEGVWNLLLETKDNDGARFSADSFSIVVTNTKPTIADFNYTQLPSGERKFILTWNANDPDGWISDEVLTLTSPSGIVTVDEDAWNGTQQELTELGEWNIYLKVIDSSGAETFSENLVLNVENSLPNLANINFDQTNPDETEYNITFEGTDLDGYISEVSYILRSPSGVETLDENITSGMTLNLNEIGIWIINFTVIDNDGGVYNKEVNFSTGGELTPIADFTIEAGSDDRSKVFNATSSSSPGAEVAHYKFTLSKMTGESLEVVSEQAIVNYTFPSEGRWNIGLSITDSTGVISKNEISKTIYIDTLPPDPGEAGKLTLEGIDSDGDGVRDDVEHFISRVTSSNVEKKLLFSLSNIKKLINTNELSDSNGHALAFEYQKNIYCFFKANSLDESVQQDLSNLNYLTTKFERVYNNTKDRMLKEILSRKYMRRVNFSELELVVCNGDL